MLQPGGRVTGDVVVGAVAGAASRLWRLTPAEVDLFPGPADHRRCPLISQVDSRRAKEGL